MDFEISAGQVNTMLKHGEKFTLLDVREPWELEKAKIEGSKNIPMGDIPTRAHQELDPDEHIVVICHHGIRSLSVTNWVYGLTSPINWRDTQNASGSLTKKFRCM